MEVFLTLSHLPNYFQGAKQNNEIIFLGTESVICMEICTGATTVHNMNVEHIAME